MNSAPVVGTKVAIHLTIDTLNSGLGEECFTLINSVLAEPLLHFLRRGVFRLNAYFLVFLLPNGVIGHQLRFLDA